MKNQLAIQEAYGEHWENFKDFVDENGWVKKISLIPLFDVIEIDFKGKFQRPKSLQGIENNNGWVKIESEADLPKESGVYEACINEEYIGRINFSKEFNEWSCVYDSDNLRFPTHYQPIIKPQPPIY